MHASHILPALLGLLSVAVTVASADVTVQSGPGRTQLLELFTSEGCSSCPPAEQWFSSLRKSPRLWKDVAPLAFHVDYWDYLGWRDPLASRAATARQHAYAASWKAGSVYTPGFVLNGEEWRGRDLGAIPAEQSDAGKISATMRENGEVQITYLPAVKTSRRWELHAALLGFGITYDVKAGENNGRKLIHDFAVLAHESAETATEVPHAVLHLPASQVKHGETALAVWVTEAGHVEPKQAAGGNL